MNGLLVIALSGQGTEAVNALLVALEVLEILLESLNSVLKLVLLEDDLAQLPRAVLCSVVFLVDALWQEVLKSLVSDRLPEVDILELFVEILDAFVKHVVDFHAGRHEATFETLHLADVVAFLGQRHAVELFQLILFLV